ncbi:ABC transporter ATP-binding protein [Mesorhizobium sp. INR15]|uniref:ABC transporter ATP-binding protein n=1 Tax=Mesorhizobium sp. INR15 TaxID=2654248 RepID=UPI00215665FD|nr:ABC transporter ATP-binding protein [Mesorhizobium sp. INR15]
MIAVEDFSIDIRRGEFLTLLGPSGSGKSTVLSMIAGFSRPDGGSILLNGQDITNWSPEKRAFGMVYQGYALFPHMNVAENIGFGLRMRGKPKAEIDERVASLLERVRLEGFGKRLPRQLSGGQQQRVALARAIAFEPHLLLLDEPLSALDRQLRADVQRELRDLNRDLGLTFIFITHDQDEAMSLSDRVGVMTAGRLAQIGTPNELYEHPATRFIAGFLGRSNFMEGVVEEQRGGEIAVRAGAWRLVANAPANIPAGASVTLAVRPERIVIGGEHQGGNQIKGTVKSRIYLGSSTEIDVHVDGIDPVLVTTASWPAGPGSANAVPEPGQTVSVWWPAAASTVLVE